MLAKEENELLCRVGAGTPMGDLMREYWIPALMSSELAEPDCPPQRLRLLGEDLIAFRATSGRVGIVVNSCPHRGASLFYGRNEEEGLRCVYHGWKFDTTGQCVDMPSEPPESVFKTKVSVTSYACEERNGVIWTYMGSRETPPPLPDIEPNMLEGDEIMVQKVFRECNWMQSLEGDIDTSHLAFLHLGHVSPEEAEPKSFNYYTVADRAPRYSIVETDFGTSYGAYRPAEEDTYYWRIANFLFPFYAMIPTGVLGMQILVRAWVPVDDDHTMFWSFAAPATRQGAGSDGSATSLTRKLQDDPTTNTNPLLDLKSPNPTNSDARRVFPYVPDTSDSMGKWRLDQNKANDYKIDREAQKSGASYTGVDGILQQDQAMTESMGPIYDRSREHLGTSDAMVIRTRLRLIHAAKDLREQGSVPPGVDNPEVYRVRSGGVILPRSADWLEATKELRKAFVQHAPESLVTHG